MFTLLIVPAIGILSCLHPDYYGEYVDENLDADNNPNNLKAWLSVYPMVCFWSIVKYVVMHEQELF